MESIAERIMLEFGRSTGLAPVADSPRRYLWTDAFAVCNFLELHRITGKQKYQHLALDLIDQVHQVLGHYRPDDARAGWISNLDEEQGRAHPTIGGLRIGKPLPERRPDEPFDERLEWDRDGQYFHYLTKWMHALGRAGALTGEAKFQRWAMELAKTAYAAFVYTLSGSAVKRMHWKLSTDLSYPLVAAMGQHDPLDGLITCLTLRPAAPNYPENNLPGLAEEIAGFQAMCEGMNLSTSDVLGLGGLLADAGRVAQLMANGQPGLESLLEALLQASLAGLRGLLESGVLQYPAANRLAFRELGLSIGLQSVRKMQMLIEYRPHEFNDALSLSAWLRELQRYTSIGADIESFWLDPASQATETWSSHRDINSVMLATSLGADSYLEI